MTMPPTTPGAPPTATDRPRRRERPSTVQPTRYTVHVIEDGDVVTREVEIGVMNRLSAEVKSGLKVGDEVVLDGGTQPANGRRQGGGGPGGFGGGPRI